MAVTAELVRAVDAVPARERGPVEVHRVLRCEDRRVRDRFAAEVGHPRGRSLLHRGEYRRHQPRVGPDAARGHAARTDAAEHGLDRGQRFMVWHPDVPVVAQWPPAFHPTRASVGLVDLHLDISLARKAVQLGAHQRVPAELAQWNRRLPGREGPPPVVVEADDRGGIGSRDRLDAAPPDVHEHIVPPLDPHLRPAFRQVDDLRQLQPGVGPEARAAPGAAAARLAERGGSVVVGPGGAVEPEAVEPELAHDFRGKLRQQLAVRGVEARVGMLPGGVAPCAGHMVELDGPIRVLRQHAAAQVERVPAQYRPADGVQPIDEVAEDVAIRLGVVDGEDARGEERRAARADCRIPARLHSGGQHTLDQGVHVIARRRMIPAVLQPRRGQFVGLDQVRLLQSTVASARLQVAGYKSRWAASEPATGNFQPSNLEPHYRSEDFTP